MSKFTTIAIYPEDLEKLNALSSADMRSNPKELAWLIEQELNRRATIAVEFIRDLPHPEGAQVVPLIGIRDSD